MGEFSLILQFENNNKKMTTFIGEYTCKIDAKGRIVLPSAFKKQLKTEEQESFVVKKDIFEDCLVIFPMQEWEKQVENIRAKLNPYNKEHNLFLRNFHRGKAELSLDANNRMLIPKRLLDLLQIEKEVILVGIDNKIEIWNKKVYESMEMGGDDFANLTEKILGGEI